MNKEFCDAMGMWVICKNPSDYPGFYTARIYVLHEGKIVHPSGSLFFSHNLKGIRAKLPPGLNRVERSEEDDPVVIESWI